MKDKAAQAGAALTAAQELAEEARDNGNDWAEWCKPRLDLIASAISENRPSEGGPTPRTDEQERIHGKSPLAANHAWGWARLLEQQANASRSAERATKSASAMFCTMRCYAVTEEERCIDCPSRLPQSAPASSERASYMPGLKLAEELLRKNGFEKSALAVSVQIRHLEAQPQLDAPESASGSPEELRADNERMRKALDAIYNHNEAARAAVVQHYGLWHRRVEGTAA